MTRAMDRLLVCGAVSERGPPQGCWWNLVTAALRPPVSVEEPADDREGQVWRYRKRPASAPEALAASPASVPADPPPPWVYSNAAAEPPPVRLLSPATAYDEATP